MLLKIYYLYLIDYDPEKSPPDIDDALKHAVKKIMVKMLKFS